MQESGSELREFFNRHLLLRALTAGPTERGLDAYWLERLLIEKVRKGVKIMKNHHSIGRFVLVSHLVLSLILLTNCVAFAQTSEFTHQGKFPETGGTASGNYQMEFKLFDAPTGGNQIGTTISIASVSVTKSVFSVNLDFGVAAFPGADRFLEIAARKSSTDPFTILGPRQKITSAPYSIKSNSAEAATTATTALTADSAIIANTATRANTATNALQLGGMSASRFVRFDDNDNVGIGTISTGSKLEVAGTIESKSGGIKFPDATMQTTAGLTAINTNTTLTGNGTAASPLSVASPLLIRDLDNPARQPFYAQTFDSGSVVTVPDGKRLVIETVTGIATHSNANFANEPLHLVIFSDSNQILRRFNVSPSFTKYGVDNTHTYYTHSLRLYVSSGERLFIGVPSAESPTSAQVSGYWIDVP